MLPIRRLKTCLLILLLATATHAEIRLPSVISDHMVVQQGRPVPVFGWADPGEGVTVNCAGTSGHAVAGEGGRWRVTLDPLPVGSGPLDMVIICGDEQLTVSDILVGEVWLCSGQSNMSWTMQASDKFDVFRADADRPTIRMFTVPQVAREEPQEDLPGSWQTCSPETVGGFSAVGYQFGRVLSDALSVPIGLIHSSWGGSAAEAWVPRSKLETVQAGQAILSRWDALRIELDRDPLERAGAGIDDTRWAVGQVPDTLDAFGIPDEVDGIFWYRIHVDIPADWEGRSLELSLGAVDDDDVTYFDGVEIGRTRGWQNPRRYQVPGRLVHAGDTVLAIRVTDGAGPGGLHGEPGDLYLHPVDDQADRRSLAGSPARVYVAARTPSIPTQHRPGQLYNAMLHPLLAVPLAGVTWYQGESNAIGKGRAEGYVELLPLLIKTWRDAFDAPRLPFLIVQLANLDHPSDWDFPLARDVQRRMLEELPATGLAVTIDIGNPRDIHPRNKHDVGDRLARWALVDTYGVNDLVKSGPVPVQIVTGDDHVFVIFNNFHSPIMARGMKSWARDTEVSGFEVAGSDGVFHAATALIKHECGIWITGPDAANPIHVVRYAWQGDPEDADLVNEAGLPATPFQMQCR